MTAQGPGQALFTFVRHWSRKPPVGDTEVAVHGRLVLVTEAVHALGGRGIPATVNAVASEIGLDQSGTSRLIKSATEAGHLSLAVHGSDGRRREASLTPAGRTLLEQAHRWQEQVFDQLTDGWSAARRLQFQRSMRELVDRSYALDSSPAAHRG